MSDSLSEGKLPVSKTEFPLGGSSTHPPQSITLLARFESLTRVRDFVAQAAKVCGLEANAIYQVQLAVDEAFTNAIEHAYGGECLEQIQCTCQIRDDGLSITMRDCGRPFDPAHVPDPDLESGLQERRVGGLGLYFMRHLMDEVEFTFIPASEGQKRCNLLRMFKRKERKT